MKFRIIWAGKTKEAYAAEGVAKYLKLLGALAKVEVVEVREQKGGPEDERLRKEGERILKQTSSFVLLDERGPELTSVEFAEMLRDRGRADFVVGGAYGVSAEVKAAASETLALSRMTLTHEMARVLLLEQLYRAVTILKGGGYHH
ncbi:MAG: 23S rRNA (pseudouridine(1915)-N(3))-methyltransferase RlmH [Nitrospirota bacterium]|jgi:23S rRNA (pseudouridine1915-N3)-methyltransferase